MKHTITLGLLSVVFVYGCGNATKEETHEMKADSAAVTEKTEQPAQASEATIKKIDMLRDSIEKAIGETKPVEMSTDGMKEQIKQKWSKIHFYAVGGSLLRVHTYPHASISKRTEEFYFHDGKLVLAVIEDNGEGAENHDTDKFSKMYYYDNEMMVHEVNNSKEEESSVRNSDGERMLQESKEYLGLFANKK